MNSDITARTKALMADVYSNQVSMNDIATAIETLVEDAFAAGQDSISEKIIQAATLGGW